MDFGDILDEWDRQTAKSQGKKGKKEKKEEAEEGTPKRNERTAAPVKPPAAHPLEAWLNRHDVYDKDAANPDGDLRPWEARRRLLHKKPDATIDLHGLTQHEAWTALEAFFSGARSQGFEKLWIIHGKGNHSAGGSVLGRIVQKYLERCPFAGENGHGNASSGGSGVTWVLLKKTR
ncbi:MAG: Smr/MutS family protein [Spirochaetaceae bacterium]|jgi:DNA-nicking Smr family endonuclease|nr:Smr/MutS family protein [Spirochaetaceae bacterium]